MNAMRYRALGNTGLSVSIIGFGAAPLGDVYGKMTVDECAATVTRAIDHGVNLFDVSPYYGLTLAEERLGIALGSRRDDIILATKCGRYGAKEFDFSPAHVTREFENSLRRLRTGYVDLLQIHDVEFGSIDLILYETIPALRRLQEQGKARFIGITGYWPGLLARMAGEVSVDTVLNYCHANLLMDDLDAELAPTAQRLGFGLMNASPLHMGLLGGDPIPEWHPAPATVRQAAAQVVALCRQSETAPATLALAACLDHPAVASTFIGFNSTVQVDQAFAALDSQPPPDLLQTIREIAAPVFNTVWPSGLAENEPTPLPLTP